MATRPVKIDITAQNKTGRAFNEVNSGLNKMSGLVAKVGGAIAGAFAVASLARFGKQLIDTGDLIQKLSIRLGASTEALSELRFAAKIAGLDFTAFSKAIQKMQEGISDAVQNTGEAKDALKELGISAQELIKLKPETQFEVIAESLSGVENATDRVRIATDLFGARGVALLQIMEDGAGGIRKLRGEAQAFGVSLTRAQTNDMANFNDALARLGAAFEGFGNKIVLAAGPALTTFIEFLAKKIPSAGAIMGESFRNVMQGIALVLESSLEVLRNYVTRLRDAISFFGIGTKTLDSFIVSLNNQIFAFQLNREAFAKTKVEIESFDAAVKRNASTLTETHKNAIQTMTQGVRQSTEAIRENDRLMKSVETILKQTVTPAEKYAESLADIMAALDKGIITLPQFERAAALLQTQFEKNSLAAQNAQKKIDKSLGNTADKAEKAGEAIGESFGSAFSAAIFEADNAASAIGGIFQQLGQKLLDIFVFDPIVDLIGGVFKGGFSSIFSAKGNAFVGGRLKKFATGGVVNSPTFFGAGPNTVGVAGEAGTEGIFPLKRLGGELGVRAEIPAAAKVNVFIENNSNEQASVSDSTTSNGGRDIFVVIGERLAQDVRSNGPLGQAIESSFGSRRQTIGR